MTHGSDYQRYWGKTRPAYHLLPYHGLDVAAVGQEYLRRHPRLREFLARGLGLSEESLVAWLTFFLALHDLGKFAETFQNRRPDLFHALQGRESDQGYAVRHDTLGYLAWRVCVWPVMASEDWLGLGAGDRQDAWEAALRPWAWAVTGHHGQPPHEDTHAGATLHIAFAEADQAALLAYVRAVREILLDAPSAQPDARPERKTLAAASKRLSWWLAGIAVLADWLGSNTRYFDFCNRELPLAQYWRRAQRQARIALHESGVLPVACAAPLQFAELFPYLAEHGPSPLQVQVGDLALGGGPTLWVLEDATGAGKTEAALWLVHRLMAAGEAQGLYVGLPTMATANAMYERLADVYRRLFAAGRPSLVLAHGARDLSDRFLQSVMSPGLLEDDYREGETSAGVCCAAWLADSRKKALLAQVGVGTVDQALLGILPSRHQSLRLLGLFGKVLVVDEVHAYDAYQHRLLQALLGFHAAAGGSAVLLSATLPRRMREELAAAFRSGLGRREPTALAAADYPLLTEVRGAGVTELAVPARRESMRRVEVSRLDALEQVCAEIAAAAQAGHCVCWVRNTVADAREAYVVLGQHLPPGRLALFHARFAMGDRLALEQQVLARFGKHSTAEQRRGQVLVATQVVEQSLDLDFDLLVSDLAPIDLIIQRAGRLCRHPRDAAGNRCDGPDQRGTPRLLLYGPAPADEVGKDWYSRMLPSAARVYPNHARLWLTAKLLRDQGGFTMPTDARVMVEQVYGDAAPSWPAALDASDIEDQGARGAQTALALNNRLPLEKGYTREFGWDDDVIVPTRLAEPETMLRLARWDGIDLRPWCGGPHGWDLSQVRMRRRFAERVPEPDDSDLAEAVQTASDRLPDRGRWSLLVPMAEAEAGRWQAEVIDERGERVVLHYDTGWGLLRDSEVAALSQLAADFQRPKG